MAASDHLHPHQMKMFMSPNELHGYVSAYGDLDPDRPESGIAFKLRESKETPFYDSVASEGVKKPIEISHFSSTYGGENSKQRNTIVLSQGHHRVFSQAEADPDRLMPVIHHLDSWSGRGAGRYFPLGQSHISDPRGEKR